MDIAGPQRLIVVASQTVAVTNAGAREMEAVMNYEQGPEGRAMYFTLTATNVPKGSAIGLNCDVKGAQPPLVMPPTLVSTSPAFTTGLVSEVPAGFAGPIKFFAKFPAGIEGPIGASLRLQVAFPVDTEA
jgi:hypothetical protein